jgi:hypothetical protein
VFLALYFRKSKTKMTVMFGQLILYNFSARTKDAQHKPILFGPLVQQITSDPNEINLFHNDMKMFVQQLDQWLKQKIDVYIHSLPDVQVTLEWDQSNGLMVCSVVYPWFVNDDHKTQFKSLLEFLLIGKTERLNSSTDSKMGHTVSLHNNTKIPVSFKLLNVSEPKNISSDDSDKQQSTEALSQWHEQLQYTKPSSQTIDQVIEIVQLFVSQTKPTPKPTTAQEVMVAQLHQLFQKFKQWHDNTTTQTTISIKETVHATTWLLGSIHCIRSLIELNQWKIKQCSEQNQQTEECIMLDKGSKLIRLMDGADGFLKKTLLDFTLVSCDKQCDQQELYLVWKLLTNKNLLS